MSPDSPYKPLLEPYSIDRFIRIENARERDNAEESRDSGDWLVRLIERKLKGGD